MVFKFDYAYGTSVHKNGCISLAGILCVLVFRSKIEIRIWINCVSQNFYEQFSKEAFLELFLFAGLNVCLTFCVKKEVLVGFITFANIVRLSLQVFCDNGILENHNGILVNL